MQHSAFSIYIYDYSTAKREIHNTAKKGNIEDSTEGRGNLSYDIVFNNYFFTLNNTRFINSMGRS